MSAIARTLIPSSVVQSSALGFFRSFASVEDVVFSTSTSLELLSVSDEGRLQSLCHQSVCGNVTEIRAFPDCATAEFKVKFPLRAASWASTS